MPCMSTLIMLIALICLAIPACTAAESLALREEISLNDAWEQGGAVPVYGGMNAATITYQRKVTAPTAWAGYIVRLEFERVNFIADLYINDRHVTQHIGGWIPFAADVTPYVTPGTPFILRVEVKSANHEPISDGHGRALWPLGTADLGDSHTGIAGDVWLRAYGKVYQTDTFIQTSYRKHRLTVDYTLTNSDTAPHTVRITGEVRPWQGEAVIKQLCSPQITLAPGETKQLSVPVAWNNPTLWTPETPVLYTLTSRVMEGNTSLDQEQRRFGFREIWIADGQFMLNGIRINLWGDNVPVGYLTNRARELVTREAWPATARMLKDELHYRIIRFHQAPAPNWMLDVLDEVGLLAVDETPLYCGNTWGGMDQTALITNSNQHWVGPWVIGHRNHPALFMWSAMNEMSYGMGDIALCKTVGDTIRKYDPTRPVTYEGEGDVGDAVVNDHYPEGYESLDAIREGDIYNWENRGSNPVCADRPAPGKPTGFGEFLACPWVKEIQPDVYWWQGTWVRGMRYLNFTDIRPFLMHWAWTTDTDPAARQNLINSFAPVALFDREYDALGITPMKDGTLPVLQAGSTVTRHLVLYNDELHDTTVTVEVAMQVGGATLTDATRTYTVPLGGRIDIPCTFQAPVAGEMTLLLTTKKSGRVKFSEARLFTVTGNASSTPVKLTLGDALPGNIPLQTTLEVIQPFPYSTERATGTVRVTLRNQSKRFTANGELTLAILPAPVLPYQHSYPLPYTLKPGQQAHIDLDITLPPGVYVAKVLARDPAVQRARIPLIVVSEHTPVIPRIGEVKDVKQLVTLLANAPAFPAEDAEHQQFGAVRLGVSGANVALYAHVIDHHVNRADARGDATWNGSEVEVYGAMPGTNHIGQTFLLPQAGDVPAAAQWKRPDRTVPAPDIQLATTPTADGYDICALIPFNRLKLDTKTEAIIFELQIAATPVAGGKLQYSTLFGSVNAYAFTNKYGLLLIAK